MTGDDALALLGAAGDPERAAQMAAHHKIQRRNLGIASAHLDMMVRDWRRTLQLGPRLDLARALWQSDVHEARIAAAKLLTQARIKPDDAEAWALITSWVPELDSGEIADAVCSAGQRRLSALPARLDEIEPWTGAEHIWTKRAALVMTLPWAKLRHSKPADIACQERILGWVAGYAPDKDMLIQKSVAWWLRELSRHQPDRTAAFLQAHGGEMTSVATKEAASLLIPRIRPLPANSSKAPR